jgi:hypothetical protein
MKYPLCVGERTSRLRQRLLEAAEQHREQVERLLREDGALIRGSFGTRARLCGNPNCHCARGQRHTSKYLTATDGDRQRQVHVPTGDERRVADGVSRYRRFRESKKRLAEIGALVLELVEDLGRSLLAPYPPNDPLPPARRRGRKSGARQS